MYVTITGFSHYMGVEAFNVGQVLFLEKDIDNHYDDEAIAIKSDKGVKYGYIANSTSTVARGTHSAGYVYEKINNNDKCKVLFITDEAIIAEITNK